MNKKKRGKKQVTKEIKQAVEELPQLLFQTQPKSPLSKIMDESYYQGQQKRKQLVWVGVSIVGVCILIFWILRVDTLIQTTIGASSPEQTLIKKELEQAKYILQGNASSNTGVTDFDELINKTNSIDTVKQTIENLATAIAKVGQAPTTTVATTTPQTETETTTVQFTETAPEKASTTTPPN